MYSFERYFTDFFVCVKLATKVMIFQKRAKQCTESRVLGLILNIHELQ